MEIDTKPKEKIISEQQEIISKLEKAIKKTIKSKKYAIRKLGARTRSLWFAAGVIADNNLSEFGEDQEVIYSKLKAIGLLMYDDAEMQNRIKTEEKSYK